MYWKPIPLLCCWNDLLEAIGIGHARRPPLYIETNTLVVLLYRLEKSKVHGKPYRCNCWLGLELGLSMAQARAKLTLLTSC